MSRNGRSHTFQEYIFDNFQSEVLALIRNAMMKAKDSKGFLIDGYPRELEQGIRFENEVSRSVGRSRT